MTIDKQKLKALAEAATQSHGVWRVEVDHNGVHVIGDGSWKILSAWHTPDGKGAQNAEFAAAASPATVMALLAEIERLECRLEVSEDTLECIRGCLRAAESDIDQLKAENEALVQSRDRAAKLLEQLESQHSELRAALVSVERDAERYRWTAIDGNWLARMFGKWRAHTGEYGEANPTAWYPSRGEAIDAAISHAKAMAKEASHG